MAEYYFQAGFVSRSKGQSTIAKAAYNSREKLMDHRDGQARHYKGHSEPEFKAIFLPEGAPEWMRDREKLWNAVEAREDESKRHATAQPSRAWIIGIPHWEGQTPEQRVHIAKDYGRLLARAGFANDMAIHEPENDKHNYHLHIQIVMREITPEGLGNRIRLADKEKGITAKQELEGWKEKLVNLAARHMERGGVSKQEADRYRFSHRTLKVQSQEGTKRGDHEWADICDRVPTIHLGAAAFGMEKRQIKTERGNENRAIKEENKQRAELKAELREIDHLVATGLFERWQTNPKDFATNWVPMLSPRVLYNLNLMVNDHLERQHTDRKTLDKEWATTERVIAQTIFENYRQDPKAFGEQWKSAGEQFPRIGEYLDKLAEHLPQRTYAAPESLNTVAANVWMDYQRSQTREDFTARLQERGMRLAEVTRDDAQKSIERAEQAKESGIKRYMPIFQEGGYAIVTKRGSAFALTPRMTGTTDEHLKMWLGNEKLPSVDTLVRERDALMHVERKVDPRPTGRLPRPKSIVNKVGGVFLEAEGMLSKGVSILDSIASAFESIVNGIGREREDEYDRSRSRQR